MSNIVYHGKRLTLFNIAKYMLGYEKITEDVHKEWCDNLEEAIKTHKRIMRLKPRGTYKTTIYNVSFVIDRLLDDYVKHDGKFTLRILITSATNDLAEQILSEIKEQLTKNENIKQFFADFGNDNPITRENQQEIILNPRIIKKEPNLKARGALSAMTSEHYDIIICDDVCYDDKTEILTDNGWKLFKDLEKGVDLVATLNPNTNEIEYQKPIRYIEKDYKGEMIGVNHPTIDFLVTPDHGMYFGNWKKEYSIKKACDIYGKYGFFKKNGIWKGVDKEKIVFDEVRYKNNYTEEYVRKHNWYKTNYDGKVYCVEVPNHIIYVRRNGKGLFLGNCNNADRESAAIREQKKRWYKDLISILEPDGLLMVIGTRWSDAELYGEIIEQNPKLPDFMRYDIEIDSIIDEHGKPKYPTIYDENKIKALRIEKGAVEFSSQYLNQPLPSETQLFNIENMHFYTELKRPQERAQNPFFKDCKHVIYVDPALGNENDFCVIIVGAIKDHVLYVRDCWLSNTSPPNVSIEKMVYYYNFYNCEELGIETNGFQSLISQYLKERNDKIKDMRKRMKIKEIKNQKRKRIRIESVEPFVTSGKVLFRDDWTEAYPELINQLVRYPVHKHDDAPDALEGLVRMTINKSAVFKEKGKRGKRKFMIGINRR